MYECIARKYLPRRPKDEVSQDYQRDKLIVGQIVNLMETAKLGDVDEQDIEELLEVSGEGSANDDLTELAGQGIEENENWF
ncbi:hypothetical protein Btru_065874 [Bulinus truncatus]|nr:hypothetical protein Btru_065874 [Bulinus truncatus]